MDIKHSIRKKGSVILSNRLCNQEKMYSDWSGVDEWVQLKELATCEFARDPCLKWVDDEEKKIHLENSIIE